ncbi:DNA-binding protein [Paraburkholderia sediminicola]|uniref:DNA-binding protein n=1 Tax=Paraburkholderia sediminicola TaxID=458836 RepID=UPI0038B88A0F
MCGAPGKKLRRNARARDALLAQGQHPSLDAIRIALGNTGSKTAILKKRTMYRSHALDRRPTQSGIL